MRIGFIAPGFINSGGMRIIFEYANRLTFLGHDVKVYVPYRSYNYYKGNFKPVYNLKRIIKDVLYKNKREFKNFFDFKFKIKKVTNITDSTIDNLDIVIATGWPTAFSVYNLNSSKGKKVYFIQDFEIWNSNIKLVEKSYQLPLNRITISKYLNNLLIQKYNSDSTVILNGIDFNVYRNDNKIYNENPRITFIVSEIDRKNLMGTLYVISKIHNEFPDTKICCFGFNYNDNIPDYAEFFENPSEDKIVDIYSKSDIFLFTSLYEGFGLPPAEAMACKCAVVTNNVGAVPEYSSDTFSALHCNPDNPEEIYQKTKYLIRNKDKIISISENAYKDIRKYLDWNKSVNEFNSFLQSIFR